MCPPAPLPAPAGIVSGTCSKANNARRIWVTPRNGHDNEEPRAPRPSSLLFHSGKLRPMDRRLHAQGRDRQTCSQEDRGSLPSRTLVFPQGYKATVCSREMCSNRAHLETGGSHLVQRTRSASSESASPPSQNPRTLWHTPSPLAAALRGLHDAAGLQATRFAQDGKERTKSLWLRLPALRAEVHDDHR